MESINLELLRVGNLVLDGTQNTTKIETIILEDNRIRYGIKLTEQWFKRLGFEEDIYPNWKLTIGAINLYCRIQSKTCYSSLEGIYLSDTIQFVHDVQNLYLDLKKYQLNINP